MRVLYLSGLYPLASDKALGIFVTNRLAIVNEKLDYLVFAFRFTHPEVVRFVKGLPTSNQDNGPPTLTVKNVIWHYIPIRLGILESFKKKLLFKFPIDRMLHCLQKEIDVRSFDLIHVHWVYPEGGVASEIKRRHGIPYVVTPHGGDIQSFPMRNNSVKRQIIEILEGADRVFFVSEGHLHAARNIGYRKDNCVVIPNGVDTKLFYPALAQKENFTVGFVGNLSHTKGADRLPRIFKAINDKNPAVKFAIVGEGPLKKKILKEFDRNNLQCALMPRVEHDYLARIMKLFDILILPSRKESFGCVILEAHASGIPVVGSNVGGIKEAIGDGGYLVDEGENFEERFAKAVLDTINLRMDPVALRKRAELFDWSAIVDMEIKEYKEIV